MVASSLCSLLHHDDRREICSPGARAHRTLQSPLRTKSYRQLLWPPPRERWLLSPWGVVLLEHHFLTALLPRHHFLHNTTSTVVTGSDEGCSDARLLVSPPLTLSSLPAATSRFSTFSHQHGQPLVFPTWLHRQATLEWKRLVVVVGRTWVVHRVSLS